MSKFRMQAVIAAMAASFAFSAAAEAKPVSYTIDAVHSNVQFTIRHLVSKVTGSFGKFSGTLVYDAENVAGSSASVSIDPASIDTANERRDGHLKSPDFFDVAKFPEMSYATTKITTAGAGPFTIDGNLTMHGVTKPVQLTATLLGEMKGPDGSPRIGFEATGKLDRKDFGIVWNRMLDTGALLGDDVTITIQIEALVPSEEPKEAPKEQPKTTK